MSAIRTGGGRPDGYYLKDGKRVPGVTTVLKYKDVGGLLKWAWKCGRDNIDIDKARDTAADAGHLAHQWIDDEIHDRPLADSPLPQETHDKARSAYEAFLRWRDGNKLEIIETESPLVSEQHRFGGTFDALARASGRLILLDWKSSNGVYPEYLCQLGGYDILVEEHRSLVEGAELLRFGKEEADFHHHSFTRAILDVGRRGFILQRELYDINARLGKVVK